MTWMWVCGAIYALSTVVAFLAIRHRFIKKLEKGETPSINMHDEVVCIFCPILNTVSAILACWENVELANPYNFFMAKKYDPKSPNMIYKDVIK